MSTFNHININVLSLGFLILVACHGTDRSQKKPLGPAKVQQLTHTPYSAMGTYISDAKAGERIINWSEEVDTTQTHILKFRILDTNTQVMGEELSVPPSLGMQAHHESMAKIMRDGQGTLYALFRFKREDPYNRHVGSVYYAVSNDDGQTWSPKKKLVEASNSQSQGFYDMALLPDGSLGACWLDSRKKDPQQNGSSLYFAKTNGEAGFVNETLVVSPICQCCRTDMFVFGNTLNIAFRNIAEGSIRDMYLTQSIDNGAQFSVPSPMGKDYWKIAGCPHTGPSLAHNGNDLAVTWFTGSDTGTGLYFKKLTGEISLYESKKLVNSKGKHPQMTALKNGNYYLVYEEAYEVADQRFNRIILQTFMPDGTEIKKQLSASHGINLYPAISKTADNSLLVAWEHQLADKTEIRYVQMNL
ncbi:MAG: sialidase family protein [Lutibacter sp.]|jgi:hypothetical protein|nr:sialidase family protein [Lutibacter sp.]